MVIRWDSESDWQNEQDSSGAVGRNGDLKQGYSRERPDLSSGLIGYWPLHDDSATDYSGNGNHGTLNGGLTTGVAGKAGLQAMSFDGNDDYIDTGFSSAGNQFTVSVWVKGSGGGNAVAKRQNNGDYQGWELSSYSDSAAFRVVQSSGTNANVTSSKDIDDGNWHFLTGTFDGENARLYVDGELLNQENNNIDITTDSTVKIGSRDGPNKFFNGQISNPKVYSRVLTETEIRKLYNWGSGDFARPPTDSDGGIAYYALDGTADDQWGSNDASDTGVIFDSGNFVRGQSADTTTNNNYLDTGILMDDSVFSISAWGYARSLPNFRFLVSSNDGSNGIGLGSTGGDWLFNVSSNDTYVYGSSAYTGAWVHLVGVFDNGNLKLYTNGEFDEEATGGTNDSNKTLRIGSDYTGNNPWDGWIDDIRIYNKALNPREIFQLYRYGTRGRDMRRQLVNY